MSCEESCKKRERSGDDDEATVQRCGQQVLDALTSIDAELMRSSLAYRVSKHLHEKCAEHGIDDMSLFVGFVFETIAARSVYKGSLESRRWLHPQLDVHRNVAVQRREGGEPLGILKDVKYCDGTIIACILEGTSDGVAELPLDQCEAAAPIPLHIDPMLPCGEIVQPHRSPQSVYQLCLSKLCDNDKEKKKSFNSKKKAAWSIADAATCWSRDARYDMAAYTPKALPRGVLVSKKVDEKTGEEEIEVKLNVDTSIDQFAASLPFQTTHVLAFWQYQKLRRFYRTAAERRGALVLDDIDEVFHLRLFAMLQRYTGVTGLFSRIEAGWHAAVPPEPFDYLRYEMGAEAECFASPLNARIDQFCSAFGDTDKFFGSKGSFHEFFPTQGCFEVGPPYDHEVIRIAFDHALECLDAPTVSGPLCFVFIVPESTRDAGMKVRENVDKSPYNRASEALPKRIAKYVDGFQHRPGENRLICISCDTRLIVLQNEAATRKWPPQQHFEELKRRWEACRAVIDTKTAMIGTTSSDATTQGAP